LVCLDWHRTAFTKIFIGCFYLAEQDFKQSLSSFQPFLASRNSALDLAVEAVLDVTLEVVEVGVAKVKL
jgi:hypothetical protein